jgi:hypothetical protein
MGAYLHSDGVYQKYGTTKATPAIGGEYKSLGGLREIEITLDLTTLTETETILNDVVLVPKMRIHEIEIIAKTGAATGVAIDLGLIREDRSTEIDYDGLLAAFVTASMNTAGENSIIRQAVTVPTGLAGTGALIGTTLTNPGYISASRTTATAFTAGVVVITIRYYAV